MSDQAVYILTSTTSLGFSIRGVYANEADAQAVVDAAETPNGDVLRVEPFRLLSGSAPDCRPSHVMSWRSGRRWDEEGDMRIGSGVREFDPDWPGMKWEEDPPERNRLMTVTLWVWGWDEAAVMTAFHKERKRFVDAGKVSGWMTHEHLKSR